MYVLQINNATNIIIFLVLIVSVCSVEYNNGDAIRCVPKEREALLEFRKSFTNRNSTIICGASQFWNTTERECCKWNGVQCSNTTGHVIALKNFSNKLTDRCFMGSEVSSSLLALHNLKILEVNHFIFPIGSLEFIGSMIQLQHLNFSGSYFGGTGTVPDQLWNLTNLQSLDLSNMSLYGTITPQIGNLVFLETLDLSNSYITGIIPPQIGNLIRLETLHLTSNKFNGPLPSEIGNLTNLWSLDLSQNQFFGTLPSEIGNLTNLWSLDLSQNQFFGTLPSDIGNLTNLWSLDLSQNQFFGTLPSEIGNLTNLWSLDLSQNQFFGHLPLDIGNLTNLWSLDLSQNQFSGTLLSKIEYLTNLRTLDLTNNHFSGTLPPQVWNLTNLETLDLSKNNLTSTTSGSLFNMSTNHVAPSLRKLNLRSNKLEGLPPHIRQLSMLEELDVSFNYMEATITEADLTKLTNLYLLELSFNSLTLDISPDWTPPFQLNVIGLSGCNLGPHFPSWLRTQSDITWLDLSLNNISGEMPQWLSSFSRYVFYLNISDNQLSGTISEFSSIEIIDVSSNKFSGPMPLFSPVTWIFQISRNMFSGSISFNCSMPFPLSVLDLSNNQLSGKLPNCWGNCDDLWIINLSNNSFSGDIPPDLGSLSKLNKLHLGNNNLSGELPSTLQNCKRLQLIDIGENILTGIIPTWIGEYHETMTHLTLHNNRFHGSIPPQICYLSHIQLLDLSGNNLSGKIPPCFNNFTYLVVNNISSYYNAPVFSFSERVAVFNEYTIVIWKRNFLEYGSKNIILLRLIDLSRNRLVGNIPRSFSSLKGLSSLNLSGNRLTGIIDPDIGQMSSLETLDLSNNHLSCVIPVSMAKLYSLGVLDLSKNNLSGEIPIGSQLQTFPPSAYEGNIGLCGNPLPPCSEDRPNPSTNNKAPHDDDDSIMSLSFLKEIGIPIILGFIVGFWGVVGSLIVNESWRRMFYNFWGAVDDWLCVRETLFWTKLRRS